MRKEVPGVATCRTHLCPVRQHHRVVGGPQVLHRHVPANCNVSEERHTGPAAHRIKISLHRLDLWMVRRHTGAHQACGAPYRQRTSSNTAAPPAHIFCKGWQSRRVRAAGHGAPSLNPAHATTLLYTDRTAWAGPPGCPPLRPAPPAEGTWRCTAPRDRHPPHTPATGH